MDNKLEQYARQFLRDSLPQCTEPQQGLFKRMYSPKNLNLPIDLVITQMPTDDLDWAMTQVQRTLNTG